MNLSFVLLDLVSLSFCTAAGTHAPSNLKEPKPKLPQGPSTTYRTVESRPRSVWPGRPSTLAAASFVCFLLTPYLNA